MSWNSCEKTYRIKQDHTCISDIAHLFQNEKGASFATKSCARKIARLLGRRLA